MSEDKNDTGAKGAGPQDPPAGGDGNTKPDADDTKNNNATPPAAPQQDPPAEKGKKKMIEVKLGPKIVMHQVLITPAELKKKLAAICKAENCDRQQLDIIDVHDPSRPRNITFVREVKVVTVQKEVLRGPFVVDADAIDDFKKAEAGKLVDPKIRRMAFGKRATEKGVKAYQAAVEKIAATITVEE